MCTTTIDSTKVPSPPHSSSPGRTYRRTTYCTGLRQNRSRSRYRYRYYAGALVGWALVQASCGVQCLPLGARLLARFCGHVRHTCTLIGPGTNPTPPSSGETDRRNATWCVVCCHSERWTASGGLASTRVILYYASLRRCSATGRRKFFSKQHCQN